MNELISVLGGLASITIGFYRPAVAEQRRRARCRDRRRGARALIRKSAFVAQCRREAGLADIFP